MPRWSPAVGRRLGRAFAEALAAAGADVAVHYSSSKAGAEDVVKQAQASGRRRCGAAGGSLPVR